VSEGEALDTLVEWMVEAFLVYFFFVYVYVCGLYVCFV
jgi:hypothetical protein